LATPCATVGAGLLKAADQVLAGQVVDRKVRGHQMMGLAHQKARRASDSIAIAHHASMIGADRRQSMIAPDHGVVHRVTDRDQMDHRHTVH
jgi:hypothetical protein